MADYIVKDTELTSVANSIRTAGGTNSLLSFPNGFISAVENISGGGGSSDFSTAQVTVINTKQNDDVDIYLPVVLDDEEYTGLMYDAYLMSGETRTITTVLYKGANVASLYNARSFSVLVSGNVVYDRPDFYITGDCTITIS